MHNVQHSLSKLFMQLGLDHSDAGIDRFIETHSPLASSIALEQAWFWSPANAAFLHEAIQQDAEWEGLVGQLDELLRE